MENKTLYMQYLRKNTTPLIARKYLSSCFVSIKLGCLATGQKLNRRSRSNILPRLSYYRVPTRYWKYWKSIEFQNRFSRPWKSIEIGQNMHSVLKKYGNSKWKIILKYLSRILPKAK